MDLQKLYEQGIKNYNEGKLKEALGNFLTILQHHKDEPNCLYYAGIILAQAGRTTTALGYFNHLVKIQPDHAGAYMNMATLFMRTREMGHMTMDQMKEKALICINMAIQFSPDNIVLLLMKTDILAEIGKYEELDRLHDYIIKKFPDDVLLKYRASFHAPTFMESQQQIDEWYEEKSRLLDELPQVCLDDYVYGKPKGLNIFEAKPQFPYHSIYYGSDDRKFREKYASKFYVKDKPQFKKNESGVYKIGLYADSASEGVFLRTFKNMLVNWNDAELEFHVICNLSTVEKFKATIPAPNLKYIGLSTDMAENIRTVRSHELDLIYYFECGTSVRNYFLPMFRLSRIQACGAQIPVTTGIKEMDYFLSPVTHEPDDNAQGNYIEKLYTMDTTLSSYNKPKVTDVKADRQHFGFSDDELVYLVPQNLVKTMPLLDDILAKILKLDAKARVVLVNNKGDNFKELLLNRYKKTIGEQYMDRITILPFQNTENYYKLLATADVAVDTPGFNGGSTSVDMLGLGLPIVSLRGQQMRARCAIGYYRMIDFGEELIADNIDDVAKLAVKVANDKSYRADLSKRILAKKDNLYQYDRVKENWRNFFLFMINDFKG